MVGEVNSVWNYFLASLQLGFLFTQLVLKSLKIKDKYKRELSLQQGGDKYGKGNTVSLATGQTIFSRERFWA